MVATQQYLFAAWRARPSAQFIGWFSAVRHMSRLRQQAGAMGDVLRKVQAIYAFVVGGWGRLRPHPPAVEMGERDGKKEEYKARSQTPCG